MIAALIALLFHLLTLHPAPAAATVPPLAAASHPHPRPAQTPVRVAPPRTGAGSLDNSQQPAGAPSPQGAPAGPTQDQLDTERIGRQIDCPDGSVGTMTAAGSVACP